MGNIELAIDLMGTEGAIENKWGVILHELNNFGRMFNPERGFFYSLFEADGSHLNPLAPEYIDEDIRSGETITLKDYVETFDNVADKIFMDRPDALHTLRNHQLASELKNLDIDARYRYVEVYLTMRELGFTPKLLHG